MPGDYIPGLTDGLPVFEKLLMACSRHPEKLKDVDNLINMLVKEEGEEADKGVKIITPEFEGFWDVFRKYFNKHERGK